jgi:hypothetical protein
LSSSITPVTPFINNAVTHTPVAQNIFEFLGFYYLNGCEFKRENGKGNSGQAGCFNDNYKIIR